MNLKKHHTDFFEQGIDLFNEGRFFECHEAWEEIWKRSDGEAKLFYQGLIQAAVAILHAQRGNLQGARSLHQKAREKLDPLADDHMGIALGEMRVALANFIEMVTDGTTNPLPSPAAPQKSPLATQMSLPELASK